MDLLLLVRVANFVGTLPVGRRALGPRVTGPVRRTEGKSLRIILLPKPFLGATVVIRAKVLPTLLPGEKH